jgi:hypothetical protein
MWRRFLGIFLGTAVGTLGVLYGFVLIVDPYDTLPFSPGFERTAVSTNQRFSFPALAAKSRFDSAVFGTSTTRLLNPAELGAALGGSFVNLSMNSATAYEQSEIFKVFVAAHPRPRAVIFGLDVSWCETGEMPARFTFRPFPPWLYDGDPWNDALYLLNPSAVEQAGRQWATLAGLRKTKYGHDGYRNFLPPPSEYDLAKARDNLYRGERPQPRRAARPPTDGYDGYRRTLAFPTHEYLADMVSRLPGGTLKVFLFVPYHHYTQPGPGTKDKALWDECKRRVVELAAGHPNSHVLDFMFLSRITGVDTHYWDPLHYTTAIASRLALMISTGVKERRGRPELFRYLRPAAP